MVQFKVPTRPLHTPTYVQGVDEATWALIRQSLGGLGEHRFAGSAVVESATGAPVYVVVVERAAEALPSPDQIRRHYGVTEREAEVALLAGRRLSVEEMADSLGVTKHTVRRHVERILSKLRVAKRREVREVLLGLARQQQRAEAEAAASDRVRRARRLQAVAA